MPKPKPRCSKCQAFVKASKPCRRCEHVAKAVARRIQRAERALAKLLNASSTLHWTLRKLLRMLASERRRIGLGRDRWEPLVKTIFGAYTYDLVDPRQMFLFATEPSCRPASPSPNLSRSA